MKYSKQKTYKTRFKEIQKEETYIIPTFQYTKEHHDIASKYMRDVFTDGMKESLIFYFREILGLTLNETGKRIGLTRERVRQIQAKYTCKQKIANRNLENIELEYVLEHWGEPEITDFWINKGKYKQYQEMKHLFC